MGNMDWERFGVDNEIWRSLKEMNIILLKDFKQFVFARKSIHTASIANARLKKNTQEYNAISLIGKINKNT